jgi:hypothetical protein
MDKIKISRIIDIVMTGFDHKSYVVFFAPDDVIRLEVVSDSFIGVRLIKRIDSLSNLFEKISANELENYHLVFNPLTSNEKNLGINESEVLAPTSVLDDKKSASTTYL